MDRLRRPERGFERGFVRRSRPVVIEGALDGWEPPELDDLERWAGAVKVSVRHEPEGPTGHYARRKREMTLGDYLTYLRSPASADGTLYLANVPVESLPPLAERLPFPDLVDRRYRTRRRGLYPWALWLGRRTVGPLHYHLGAEAIATQLMGRKRFLLFPPSESRHLYPDRSILDRDRRNSSRIPLVDPERTPAGFERLDQAVCFDVTLAPGEMLFIPTHWWHAVFGGEEVSLLTAAFWPSPPWRWPYPLPGLLDLVGDPIYGARATREAVRRKLAALLHRG